MKILQLASASVPHWVVEQDSILGLCIALRDRGHRIVIGCRTEGPLALFHKRAEREGFKDFVPLQFRHKFSPLADASDQATIRKALSDHAIDVVHAHRGKDHTLAVLAARKPIDGRTVPVVRTKHLLHPLNRTLLTKWRSAKHTAALITATEGLADEIAEKNGIPRAQIHPIVGGVGRMPRQERAAASAKFRERIGVARHTPLVGVVANIRPEKGIEDFIDAAALLVRRFPQIHFVVVGDFGTDKAKTVATQNRLREAGLAECFTFAGREEDPWPVYRTLTVGVIPSRASDGAGRVLHEMMAARVPIVATRVGAIPEVLANGRTGILVEPGHPEHLATGIEHLLGDPDTARRVAAAAQSDERERFSYPVVAAKVEQVYFRVLAEAQAAPAPAAAPGAPVEEAPPPSIEREPEPEPAPAAPAAAVAADAPEDGNGSGDAGSDDPDEPGFALPAPDAEPDERP